MPAVEARIQAQGVALAIQSAGRSGASFYQGFLRKIRCWLLVGLGTASCGVNSLAVQPISKQTRDLAAKSSGGWLEIRFSGLPEKMCIPHLSA